MNADTAESELGNRGLGDLAAAFARTRSAADLARLRDVVRRSPGFDVGLDVVGIVTPLFARHEFVEIVDRVTALMPGAFFSPSAHAALGAANGALGHVEQERSERHLQALALDSIRGTGDGTREHPWSVLRVSDEYDVLRAAGRAPRRQTLVEVDGRSLDRHVCDDGTEVWFDVSGLVGGTR